MINQIFKYKKPKSAEKLTDFQNNTILKLFTDDSISNKKINIPSKHNSKCNTNHSYNYLLNQDLKLSNTDKNVESVRKVKTLEESDQNNIFQKLTI